MVRGEDQSDYGDDQGLTRRNDDDIGDGDGGDDGCDDGDV